jgi:hypothetical protein
MIPARHSSLKTLYTIFRPQTNIGSITAKTVSTRSNPFGDTGSWYFSLGGKLFPQTAVKGDIEAAAEVSKSKGTYRNFSACIDTFDNLIFES